MLLNNLLEWRTNSWRFKLGFILLCFVLLFLRRPMEFLAPYVWAEDGTWNIPHYLEYGFSSLFQPVQGYLILPSKIISAVSLKISFIHYPEISTYLSACFSVFCLFLIAYAPTLLRYKIACALAVIFIPTNPEVFVLPLYSFWWGTLLIFLALLWNIEQKSNLLRIFCIILAGLSSPIIILCAPLFILRTLFYRHRIEIFSAALVTSLAALQGFFVFTKASVTSIDISDILSDLLPILAKFIAQYFYDDINYPADMLLMFSVVIFLLWCWFKNIKELGFPFFLLVSLYSVAIFATVKRVPFELIDPYTAGPRYFFYPFVLFSWVLIWLYSAVQDSRVVKYVFWCLFICALLNSVTKFYRLSESPNWRTEVEYCINNESYDISINTDGQLQNLWHLQLGKSQCSELIDKSIFDDMDNLKVMTMEQVSFNLSDFSPSLIPSLSKIESQSGEWRMNIQPVEINNPLQSRMLSSWVGSDVFTGSHKLRIHTIEGKGRIAFQTGPISKNQKITIRELDSQRIILSLYLKKSDALSILTFNAKSGEYYEVMLMDSGDGWGEWSAIFIPE